MSTSYFILDIKFRYRFVLKNTVFKAIRNHTTSAIPRNLLGKHGVKQLCLELTEKKLYLLQP